MASKDKLIEIKKGEAGTGLLIEVDGYISADCGDNSRLFEEIKSSEHKDFYCPNPFIVSAVFQKYGIENANGRIYPENVLKREVERYQIKIKERRAIGECYRPEAMMLTQEGWKHLYEAYEGELVYTLNPNTKSTELQPINYITKYHRNDTMIHIKGSFIDDIVTPDHGYPVYENNEFVGFITAQEILDKSCNPNYEIPSSNWSRGNNGVYVVDKFFNATKVANLEAKVVEYDGDVMCIEVDNHIWFVMDNNRCHWTKNCNHPNETVIDLSRVAINIIELHWEGHTLVGKIEILVSEGFRKYGIISCQGDQVAYLLLNGIKIGVSSRGLGTVENRMGALYVADDYEIVCWDVVSDPSTPNAWITPEDKIPSQYIESKEAPKNISPLFEKLSRFDNWLSD